MPRNKYGGNKHKKRKNFDAEANQKLTLASDIEGSQYGLIEKALGSGFFKVHCLEDDGKVIERRCKIRGSVRRKFKFFAGDYVLLGTRNFLLSGSKGDGKTRTGDLIMKYNTQDAKRLIKMKEFKENLGIGEEGKATGGFVFEEKDDTFDFGSI